MIECLERVMLAVSERGLRSQLFNRETSVANSVITGLHHAQLFDVENVKEWVATSHMTNDEAFQMMMDLPCCTPPYPHTYLEWATQDTAGVRVKISVSVGAIGTLSGTPVTAVAFIFVSPADSATYCVGSFGFYLHEDGKMVVVPSDKDGKPSPKILVSWADEVADVMEAKPETQEGFQALLARAVGVMLFTFSLLHCTNVSAVEVDPREQMSRQQIRDAERKNRKLLVYNEVLVKPFGSYRASKNDVAGTGLIKRLHMVRGHFAEYGEAFGKGKLFGRHSGRFFIASHARGDLAAGVVAKTYKLDKKRGSRDRPAG